MHAPKWKEKKVLQEAGRALETVGSFPRRTGHFLNKETDRQSSEI